MGTLMKRRVLLFPLLLASCATPTQVQLDSEVRRLCAVDGGIRVYETVNLPSERFNRHGQIVFYRPTEGEHALGAEYQFKREIRYYRQGNPEMSRTHYQIVRRADNKLLGETVFYGRGGGDVPGPSHDSIFVCPPYAEADGMALLKKIFVPVK